jgi:hypothetical protein
LKDVLFSDIEQLPVEDLCSLLKGFYAAARNQKGHYYSKKTMISIRYGIQRHFLKVRVIDIQASTLTYFSTCPFGQLTKKSTCPTQSLSCPKKLIKITKTRE